MKGRVGTSTVPQTSERRTCKARKMGWCPRCRGQIYPGEWIRTGKFDEHRYECPDPEDAATAYAKRLMAQISKRDRKRTTARNNRVKGMIA